MTQPRPLGDLTATTTLGESDLLYATLSGASRKIAVSALRAVLNPPSVGICYLNGGATGTTITTAATFYKLAATTVDGPNLTGWTHSGSNRLTYAGTLTRLFRVGYAATVTDGSNRLVTLRFAVNGTTCPCSQGSATTSSGGRAENISGQSVIEFATGDYIEVWATSDTSGATVTAVNLSMVLTPV